MDISCGSTRVSKFSPHVTEAVVTAKYRQSSIYSEEQNQSQRPAAPTQSGAQKFKIRSAKERQELITKSSSTWRELFDKARRSSKESREEMTSVHHISPPSLQTNMITQRRPSDLNQLGLANKVELSISPETSHRSQKKLENVESPTTTVGGRTGWRQAYLSNRSESLDWKGLKMKENQTNAISNTKDLDERSMRRSESLQHNRPNVSEPAHPSKKVSLYVHPFSGPGHKQQDSNGPISPPGSGRSPVRMVALAQSFPSRIKVDQGQYKTEERKSSWYSGHSGTKSEPAKYHLRSEATPSNITITRSHSLMDKNGHTFLEDNSDARPGVLHGIINPVPFFSSVDRNISVSSLSKMKTISYEPEKRGAFPKVPLKKEQQHFSTIADTSLVLPEGTDNSVPTLSKEKLLSQDAVSSMTNNNIFDNRRLTGNSIGLGTQSSVRTRHRHFTAPVFSANCLSNINRTEKSTKNETETQDEKTITNLKLTKGVDAKIIPGKHPHSAEEGVIGLTKSQSSQSLTGDSGQISPSSGNPTKKNEGLLEEVRNPYLASVRNTIHKFEALAQQSQSSSVIQPPRRAFSVIEKPKVTASLNKAYSNSSLGKRWGDWNREFLKEDLFNKSDVSNDAAMTIHDQSGAIQATTQDKEKTTLKTQSREVKSLEPETVQTVKQPDELPSEQKYGRFTMLNKNKDELDSAIINKSVQTPKTIDLSENKFRDYLSSTVSHSSLMSFVIANVSHAELKDPELKKKMFTKDEAFQKESTSTPQNSHSTTKIKRPSYLFSDSGVIPSIQALSDLSNPYSTIKDKKGAEKVIRWIMDKGADDENGEDCIDDEDDDGTEGGYDSDSGESSVTITSNMSNRSFSMSLLDLCSLGGLDLPPLDGSKDDENWMAKRTVSMSSDVSALSAVTLLGMDELECLLNDVRGLDDDALENYEDVHVVVLHKEAGSGLGFTVAGGVDQNKPVTVHKVLPNGLAAHEGSIHEGDQVLSINGTALHNSTHMEALHTMRKTKGRAMAVVVIRRGDVTDTCCSLKDSPQKAAGNPGSRVRVLLNKSSSDLGFSLEGGVGSPLGDKPLTVQRLFQGGPVGKVFPGDELLEVEGQSLEGLRRLEVWHLIKRLPPGHVEVLLQRPYQ